jgi:hypothetical protein
MFSNEKVAKSSNKDLYCDICDYYTSRKCNFIKHTTTSKHLSAMVSNDLVAKVATIPKYCCSNCGRVYKDNSGLWRHKKKCTNISIQDLDNEEKQQQLIEYLLKENSEFKQMMMEQNKHMVELAKNAGHNIHNTTNNNNNNSFNLQFFLNETCKDAMNIMDFVSQLQVGTKDLEETGRLGFANGISKLFINGLKQININDRPIHCSDSKRETLYIKSNNEWNKEGEDKLILTNALKHVAHKHMNKILDWTKEHPNCRDPDSRENDKYLRIVSEAMPGSTAEESNKNYTKIIKNIVKETVIEK